jgi:hypothetical protein
LQAESLALEEGFPALGFGGPALKKAAGKSRLEMDPKNAPKK